MRYSYNISHVPGKNLHTADALSRTPVENDHLGEDFGEEVETYVESDVHCHDGTNQTSMQRRSGLCAGDGILRTWLAANHDRESHDARILSSLN